MSDLRLEGFSHKQTPLKFVRILAQIIAPRGGVLPLNPSPSVCRS